MKISHEVIRKKARHLLQSSDSYKLPVDLKAVTKYLSIRVIEDNFDDDVSGLLVVKEGKAAIGINKDHSKNRQRFTTAHEIGHFILHHDKGESEDIFVDKKWAYFRDADSSKGIDYKEIEANNFAAELIMPADLTKEYIRKYDLDLFDDTTIYKLSTYLQVSEEALTIRLMKLGLVEAY